MTLPSALEQEYDAKLDKSVTDVFNRADEKMYECKKAMKGERKD